MWTNIFRIEGLHQISWFQFVPNESHLTPLPDIRTRAGQRDTATLQVLSSHLQLQKDGFLSAWTNSFVGPWDPSQGTHNPDEKIKLWLFLAGRHLSVSDRAQAAVSGLRVIASGIWVCPGDSEEVATALSQALRNRLERSLLGLSYVRYGDVFFRHRSYCHGEELFRKGQPTIEFVFAASEDAIYVHALLSAKHVRTLSGGDMEKMLKLSSNNTSPRFPVIVSPHGMRGSVTGCCSDELVKHISVGSGTSMTELVGLPNSVAQTQGYKLQGHNCYIEVSLGCAMSNLNLENSNHPTPNTPSTSRGEEKGSGDAPSCEKTFVYPSEAVLVPVLRPSYPRSSLKRFWLQNWTGMSMASSALFMYCDSKTDDVDDSWSESDGIHLRRNSSSNSNTSSMSSICSSSSDSDCITKASFGDLEADADSLNGRRSGLSSFTSMETNGPKQGLKRPRTGLDISLIQAGGSLSAPTHDCDNSDITAVANDQTGSHWDWDDDDPGVGVDIQALLSEFGDFGDFFESDSLPFGEPPGTAESQTSQTHTFSGQEFGDRGASPAATAMDVSNQNHLPVGFQTVEPFHPPTRLEECVNAVQEATKSTTQFGAVSYAPAVSTGESDRLMKAEALLSFAPEYGAVDTSSSELSSSIFKSPYQPASQKAESLNSCGNTYVYGATPPSSPGTNGPDENRGMAIDSRLEFLKSDTGAGLQKYYTQIAKVKNSVDRKCVMYDNTATSSERTSMSLLSSINSTTRTNSCQNIGSEVANGPEHLSLSRRILPASEMECLMFQASLCRIRHTLVSIGNPVPTTWNRSVSDSDSMLDSLSTKYELRKKEPILVRIAGDVDGRIPDGSSNAPIGVWRPVGAPKHRKSANIPTIEASSSLSHHTFSEETIAYGKRHPLKDFVNAIPLLVQQAASFVDLALDGEFVDGPFGWLTMEEQRRRGFCCGPHMAHAGCGGILASCHSIDIAGVDLVDPISADVQASSVMGLLQSDVKAALKSAFSTLDGPLSVIDWCKGRGQSVDAGTFLEALSAESSLSEYRDSSNIAMTSVENQLSPPHASVSISSVMREAGKGDDTGQRKLNYEHGISESEQQLGSRRQATLSVIPYPSILVGYQDDWLKTSASSLQHWEKAPLEPYAFQKHMSYYVVCPNIDSLTSAAADFFQQLGTVYEACKLGNHTFHTVGNEMDVDAGKSSTSGFLLVDSPRSTKVESNTVSLMGSMSEYFLSLSNGWDLTSFLKSLSTVLKTLPLGSCLVENAKEANSSPCTVIYVVCPFPDPSAVLQTIIESSIALTSVVCSSDNDKRSMMCSQVGKALSYGAGVDEASISNIPAISGFSIPKLVLQIVPIDAIFRVTSPSINEIVVLKEMAFTVYNKARRLSRGSFGGSVQSSSFSGRSHSSSMQTGNPVPGMWKDCVGSRISGPSLPRENDLDPGLRAGTWENTWQNARAVGLGCDSNRTADVFQEQFHCLFEPLLILAEPGSVEQGVAPTFTGNLATELTKQMSDDTSAGLTQSLCGDAAPSSHLDGSEADGFGSGQQRQPPSLHCCYGWTEDWRWLVCVWTDSRGELLDNHIFPFGGISSRQDTKGMQNLFVQVIQQGCQLLQTCSSPDNGVARARDFVITRIGCFYELECQEWQNALYFIGGSELKKWPLQLRRAGPDCVSSNSNGASLQQQELDRSLPSSPSPLYSPHSKTSSIMKGGVGQINSRKQVIGGPPVVDGSMGPLEWVQSISFVSVSMDHSLRLVSQADVSTGSLNYLEGFTPVKSLGHASASYILIPSRMRFLTPAPLQLPTCLTSESPPLAHLLHSKGYAIPLSTGFAVSKAVPSLKKDGASNIKEDWPSVLSVSLVDYFGGYSDKRGIHKQGGRDLIADARRQEIHTILESVVAELHALSWMTVSPAYLDRRSALPFHCDTVLRVRRLLHFADKVTSHQPDMAKESQSHWAPVNHGVQM